MLAPFARSAVRRRFRRRDAVWRAGDAATSFTVITRGLVEIVRRAADGSDAILAIFGPRESIGDVAALEQGRYPADAIALTEEVEVLQLARIVGATVETVIRTMSRWGREGTVETTSSGFVVRDPAALQAVASSTSPGEP